MSKFIIQGGKKLSGTIAVSGNKNAVLPIMAATILINGPVTLTNVPRIRDVSAMTDILTYLGATIDGIGSNTLTIDTKYVQSKRIDKSLATKLRASVLLLGSLYARFGSVDLSHPGGDIIGRRSIDTHLRALEVVGAKTEMTRSDYLIKRSSESCKRQVKLFLDEPSVTGTENIIMACALSDKIVHIENAACEPHIVDLAKLLNKSGANISGAGTHKMIIHGVKSLKAHDHAISSDYIEAGTFAVLAVLNGGGITIENISPDDITLPIRILQSMGAKLSIADRQLKVSSARITSPAKRIQSAPYPGFPTDLMSPFIVLGTKAEGETLFHDPLYESRMFFVDKLIRMGAQITICDPHRVIVNGPSVLHGSYQTSPDIRAGIALVIAALFAKGESIIDHAEIIERGYEHITQRLITLGADIKKID